MSSMTMAVISIRYGARELMTPPLAKDDCF